METFRFATTSISLPLGLAYVAAALEESGRAVHVVDAVGEEPSTHTPYLKGYLIGLPLEAVVARVPDDAKVVGITVIFTHEWPLVVRLVELLKQARPDVHTVLGGEHVTAMPEFCLRTSLADTVVLGEGEETITDLVEALESDRPLSDVNGLAYRQDGQIVVTPRRRRREEVDSIATPAWHLFDVGTYHEHRFVGGIYSAKPTVPILATRGCPYQCTYCAAPNMWTPRWIPRDPVKVVDEIESYVETYGARNFPFQDLTAIIQKKWIVEFCHEILRRGLEITWQLPTGTRSEAIDSEVAHLLKRSGMINMSYAPESGSEETRTLIKKRMRTDKLFESIDAAVEANLNVALFLVLGFPHDDAENLRENFAFVDRAAAAGVADCSVVYYMALPGTELFQSLYDAGRIRIDRSYFQHILSSLALVPAQNYCATLSRVGLVRWKIRVLRRFYSRRKRSARAGGMLASLRRGFGGLFGDAAHASKLQTVFRNAFNSGLVMLLMQFRRPWMPRAQERQMIAPWHSILLDIRQRTLSQGVAWTAAEDTHNLHRDNVISVLRRSHAATYTVADNSGS